MPTIKDPVEAEQRIQLEAILAEIKASGFRVGDCDACDLYIPREHRATCMTSGGEGTFCPVCCGTAVPDYIEELEAEYGPFKCAQERLVERT